MREIYTSQEVMPTVKQIVSENGNREVDVYSSIDFCHSQYCPITRFVRNIERCMIQKKISSSSSIARGNYVREADVGMVAIGNLANIGSVYVYRRIKKLNCCVKGNVTQMTYFMSF